MPYKGIFKLEFENDIALFIQRPPNLAKVQNYKMTLVFIEETYDAMSSCCVINTHLFKNYLFPFFSKVLGSFFSEGRTPDLGWLYEVCLWCLLLYLWNTILYKNSQ